MAAKFIPKVKRRSNNQPQDEFFVHDKQIVTIKKFREKLEQMYQVQLRYEKKAEDGQWLVLEGEPVDRRNAKNYIAALCHPNEVKQVQFPTAAWSQFSDPDALSSIEKKTNAVIRPLSDVAKFQISGTELAVTLAMSLMEELIGSIEENENDSVEEANKDFITISPANRNASNRLSDVLQRALSENSDGICNAQDYSHAPDSVKRVLVNCLRDTEEFDNIDEDLLFSEGVVQVEDKSKLKLICAGDDVDVDGRSAPATDLKEDRDPPPSCVGVLAEKLTDAKISTSNSPTASVSKHLSKQIEYLRSFGLSVGYSEDEVQKALDFVDDKTRPSDFLDYLGSIKDSKEKSDVEMEDQSDDDVVILETETIDIDENGVQSKVVEKNEEKSTKRERKDSMNANLPEGYRERLLRDFFQEDDNCSVEELKRRNAERQKLLKQNFQQSKPQIETEEKQQNKGAAKQKGKNKKKKQTKNQKQPQTSKPESRDSPHDKQLRLDPCEDQTYSKDKEQTCVLRIWNEGHEQPFKPTPTALLPTPIAGGFNPEPTTITHNKKQNDWVKVGQKHGGPNHKQMDQKNPWQQGGQMFDGSPKRGKQGGQMFDGSPNRGQHRKPTQVVAPVNTPVAQQQPAFSMAADSADLRYIVLDGSNVAMTHGNGKCFSCKGLRICVDYFKQRGHQKITVFVPQWRQYQPSQDNQILDQNILYELKDEGHLVFTPSRRIGRKLVAAYDDRFVLELAEAEDGIIVSNDQYRDLMYEKANWRRLIEERLLMFSYVGDRFMPPSDPLGRDGPTLDVFLRKQAPQHPQQQTRPQQWNTQYQHWQNQGFQNVKPQGQFQNAGYPGNQNYSKQGQGQGQGQGQRFRTPVQQQFHQGNQGNQFDETDGGPNTGQHRGWGRGRTQGSFKGQGQNFTRTDEQTEELYQELRVIFPEDDQEDQVRKVLSNHQAETDINKLTNYCMSVLF